MMLDEFCNLTRERIPTPTEFVEFIRDQKWEIVRRETGPALRAPGGGRLAQMMAKMLSREPYRTNVLAVANVDPSPIRRREWLWPNTGMVFVEPEKEAREKTYGDDNPHGSAWLRFLDDAAWMPIPGSGIARQPTEAELSQYEYWTVDGAIRKQTTAIITSVMAETKLQQDAFA